MMSRETGDRNFPIWLLGDSNPLRWQDRLETPLDSKHPIRHNIWTSVLDVVQEQVYQDSGIRLRTDNIYVRNAVQSPEDRPKSTAKEWQLKTVTELAGLADLVTTNAPVLLITFGAFAFEFARRATNKAVEYHYGHWGAKNLGLAFCDARESFMPSATNIIPLLHRSIVGGHFLESHEQFTHGASQGNYFAFAGEMIADILLKHLRDADIWM